MIEKLISGGQTGVDRAALDAAMKVGIPCGGWCPRGRRAEDGVIPAIYPLTESTSSDYHERTEKNVQDSDGTLIVTRSRPVGGTALTARIAAQTGKPCFIVDLETPSNAAGIPAWVQRHGVRVLNVAGPRESQCPGIQWRAYLLLVEILASLG